MRKQKRCHQDDTGDSQERERTRQFYSMLMRRSKEAHEKPEILVALDEID